VAAGGAQPPLTGKNGRRGLWRRRLSAFVAQGCGHGAGRRSAGGNTGQVKGTGVLGRQGRLGRRHTCGSGMGEDSRWGGTGCLPGATGGKSKGRVARAGPTVGRESRSMYVSSCSDYRSTPIKCAGAKLMQSARLGTREGGQRRARGGGRGGEHKGTSYVLLDQSACRFLSFQHLTGSWG
jgi:hypothetical protein